MTRKSDIENAIEHAEGLRYLDNWMAAKQSFFVYRLLYRIMRRRTIKKEISEAEEDARILRENYNFERGYD